MTNHEAIKILKVQMHVSADMQNDLLTEALQMAIKSLEQQDVTDSDTISRKQAIDALFINRDPVFHNSADFEGTLYDISNLSTLPSRPHGHWIKHHESRAGIVYSCDRCGRTLQALSWETRKDVYKIYPFCHCGADMQC